jgi:preprotein translocase subunit YajC
MMSELFVLAQATQPAPSGLELFLRQFFPIILLLGVFWWWMARARRKERQQYEEMLRSLKRNDRVVTIGGIIGTVVETRDNEVVLKVDEANNVKIRFARSAIKEVIREPAAAKS